MHVSDGTDVVTLKASSRPMADRLIAKLAFWRSARPDWQPSQVLQQALFDLDAWDRFRKRRSRGGATC